MSTLDFSVHCRWWFAERGLTFDAVAITTGQDMQITVEFTDPERLDDWQEYDSAHARLRLISAKANLSDRKVGRRANELPFSE